MFKNLRFKKRVSSKQALGELDLWTWYGQKIADVIPENYILYGELVGYLPGTDMPIQKSYTYNLPEGRAELYVYRVAFINSQGTLADLSWDGVKEFCRDRGLKWCPELMRIPVYGPEYVDEGEESTVGIDEFLDDILDKRLTEVPLDTWDDWAGWTEPPIPLSDKKTVDEGVCIRQEGIVPLILKAKSAVFLEHETKLLDKGVVDIESVESPPVTE